MNDYALVYDHVDIAYNGKKIINDVSFKLKKGEILGIVGESGSGKSTLIKAAMGLLGTDGLVTRGDIYLDGIDVPDAKPEQIRQLSGSHISMIFQNAGVHMCQIRKIGEQIYEYMTQHENVTRKECNDRIYRIMKVVGLDDCERILENYPFELSGGMNQRIGICMSMLLNPEVLLADEPTSSLDVKTQKKVVEEMLRVRDEFNTSIVVVTHNIGLIEAMCDTVLVLKDGEIKEYGYTLNVLKHPKDEYTQELMNSVLRIKKRA